MRGTRKINSFFGVGLVTATVSFAMASYSPFSNAAEVARAVSSTEALIAAIRDANINVNDNYTLTIPAETVISFKESVDKTQGDNGAPSIAGSVTIRGSAGSVIERAPDATDRFRFFHVAENGSLTLTGVTVRGGNLGTKEERALSQYDRYTEFVKDTTAQGGAIFNEGDVSISSSVFEGNSAQAGGAIFVTGDDAALTVDDVSFVNNHAWGTYGPAGAILNLRGNVRIDKSTFRGNSTHIDINDQRNENGLLPYEPRGGDGGAINNIAGDMSISNSTFTENEGLCGGAIENAVGHMTVYNSTFYDNYGAWHAGAIGAYAETPLSAEARTREWGHGIVEIVNTTITGNHGGIDGGGGILANKGSVLLRNSIVAGNTAGPQRTVDTTVPQDCGGFPLYHRYPVFIVSAGNNIIGDVEGCTTNKKTGEPMLVALNEAENRVITGYAGIDRIVDSTANGLGHVTLTSDSPAIDRGGDLAVHKEGIGLVGGIVDINIPNDVDQLGNTAQGARDIGAVEFDKRATAPTVAPPALPDGAQIVEISLYAPPPFAEDDELATDQDKSVNFSADDLLANDLDADGDEVSIDSIDSQSYNGGEIVNNRDGTFTFTPYRLVPDDDQFTYTITDGVNVSEPAVVSVAITPVALDVASPVESVESDVVASNSAETTAGDSSGSGGGGGAFGVYGALLMAAFAGLSGYRRRSR